jgi:uncharacterized protein (TIGR00251 family)
VSLLADKVIRAQGNGTVITVEVTTGAIQSEIAGVNKWRHALGVRIAAEPRDGAANEELVRFLGDIMGVPRREVRIMKGHKTSLKSVFVPLQPHKVESILEVP